MAALTMVDPDDREEMVESIERRIAELYAPDDVAIDDEPVPTIEVKVRTSRDGLSDQAPR